MDDRRWRYDPHPPPDDEPAGWVVAGGQRHGPAHRYGPAAWDGGHTGPAAWDRGHTGPPGAAPAEEPGRWNAIEHPTGEWYPDRPPNGNQPPWEAPDPYRPGQYPPDPYQGSYARPDPQDRTGDQYPPDPYLYARPPEPDPAAGPPGYPYGDPGSRYPAQDDPYDPYDPPGYPRAGAWGEDPRQEASAGAHRTHRPVAPPVEDLDGEPALPTMPALGWAAGFFVVPALLFLAWALTRSGVAPAGCVDAAGDSCLSPRAEALGGLASGLPALGGAIAFAMLTATALRRLAAAWRPATVGLAAAVIGAGIATLVAAVIG